MESGEAGGGYYRCVLAAEADVESFADDALTVEDEAGRVWICERIDAPDGLPEGQGDEEDDAGRDAAAERIVFCEDAADLPGLLSDYQQEQSEASYICDACGEEIVVPIDLSEGDSQTYVEDCPVCCRPNVIHVEVDEHGTVNVWGEPE